MLQILNRIAKRRAPGRLPGVAIAIAIAGAVLIPSLATAQQFDIQLAQAAATDSVNTADPAARPKATRPAAAKPKPQRRSGQPDDNVADDLNRREAERVRGGSAEADAGAAAPTNGAAPAAVPVADRAGVEQAPIAPVNAAPPSDRAAIPAPAPTPAPKASAAAPQIAQAPATGAERPVPPRDTTAVPPPVEPQPLPRMAQATPPAAPVPAPRVQPPAAGAQPPAAEAPSRDFGRNAVVSPEQPTLSIETNKAQFLRLKSPAATVFIANPEIADVQVRSPTLIYVFGKRPGNTVLYAVDDRERVIVNTVVSVTHEFSRLMTILDRMHPGHGIVFSSNNDNIILSGTATSAVVVEDARRLAAQHVQTPSRVINNVRVGGPNQVNLRVRVVEVNRGALKNLGVSWAAIGNFGNFAIGAITGVLTGFPGTGIPAPSGTGNNLIGASYRANNVQVDSLIQALADESLLTVLAEPNLTAMSGETASFLAGGEIPIPVNSGNSAGSITVEYKQFGVSLAFTPTIVDNRINLRVRPEVSQLDESIGVTVAGFRVPGFQTRRADTTIELGSGQSFAIAGLLMRTSNQSASKVPGLGDVPVLGALFKSDRFQRNETELVIIVTPFVVQPSSTRLATPIDGYYPPSDGGRYLYGQTNAQQQARGPGGPYGRSGQRLVGPVGFMVD